MEAPRLEAWASHATGDVPSPERIVHILRQGSESDRGELAKALELMIPPETTQGDGHQFCTSFDSVKSNYVVLKKPGSQAVIHVVPTLYCEEFQFIVVIERETGNTWRLVRTIPLFTKYNVPQISFPALVDADEHEIMIHNETVDYGTGIFQKDLVIWKYIDGGLQVVFDEVESLTFAVPTGIRERPNTDQAQKSVFTVVAAEPQEGGYKDILEKQTVRDHGTTIVRWRAFGWTPWLQRFQGVSTSR